MVRTINTFNRLACAICSCGTAVSSGIYCTPKCRQRGYRLRKLAQRAQQAAEAVSDQGTLP